MRTMMPGDGHSRFLFFLTDRGKFPGDTNKDEDKDSREGESYTESGAHGTAERGAQIPGSRLH